MMEITGSTGSFLLTILDKVGFGGFVLLFLLFTFYKNSKGLCENVIRQYIDNKNRMKDIEEQRNTALFYLKEGQAKLIEATDKLIFKLDSQEDSLRELLAKMNVLRELENLYDKNRLNNDNSN